MHLNFFDYIENIRSSFENEIAKILVEDKIKTILTYNFYSSDKQLKMTGQNGRRKKSKILNINKKV